MIDGTVLGVPSRRSIDDWNRLIWVEIGVALRSLIGNPPLDNFCRLEQPQPGMRQVLNMTAR